MKRLSLGWIQAQVYWLPDLLPRFLPFELLFPRPPSEKKQLDHFTMTHLKEYVSALSRMLIRLLQRKNFKWTNIMSHYQKQS